MSLNLDYFHPKLKKCNKCKTDNVNIERHASITGCVIVTCIRCFNSWLACSICEKPKRFTMANLSRARKHFSDVLLHPELSVVAATNQDCDLDSICEDVSVASVLNHSIILSDKSDTDNSLNSTQNVNDNSAFEPVNKRQKLSSDQTLSKSNALCHQSITYFDNEQKQTGLGICGLVSSAFTQNFFHNFKTQMAEAKFHIDATHFCIGLSEYEQRRFASILNNICLTKFVTTKIPTSFGEIKKYYINGKYSIFQNLPCPKVIQIDNHACVRIDSVLDHVLAIGIELDLVRSSAFKTIPIDNSDLLHTQQANKLLKETYSLHVDKCDPYVIFLELWSDDFQVNHTRKNRNSTWLKTVTFCPPRNMTTSKKHTHAVCLGKKKQSHSYVNKWFNDQLEGLKQPTLRYVKQMDTHIPIVALVLVMTTDRPERCAINSVLGYTGNSTRRWLYSSLLDPSKLITCRRCYSRRISNMFDNRTVNKRCNTCAYCCDLNFLSSKPINSFQVPKGYPSKKHELSPTPPTGRDIADTSSRLFPIKLSYLVLKQGLQFALFNFYTHVWTKGETKVYLKLVGIPERVLEDVSANTSSQDNSIENITQFLRDYTYPSMWETCLDLEQFIETPMHLLFEGIVKSLIEIQMDFFKIQKKWSKYGEYANTLLDDIAQLKLGYCRVEQFTNGKEFKTGGWLAETYLGYARLLVIMCNNIEDIIDPIHTTGFYEYQATLQCALALISRLMQHDVDHYEQLENYIKLFLSTCHYYEVAIGFGDKREPTWYSKSNFVSLLNLPDQVHQFGPVYLHWDGVNERYIQHVKPLLKHMRTSISYLSTKLQRLHRNSAMEHIYTPCEKMEVSVYERYNDIVIYKDIDDVSSCIKNSESISGVIIEKNHPVYCVVTHNHNMYQLYALRFNDDDGFHRCNQWYSPMSVEQNEIMSIVQLQDLYGKTFDCALVIPYGVGLVQKVVYYTVITKSWRCRGFDNSLDTFTPSKNILKKISEMMS